MKVKIVSQLFLYLAKVIGNCRFFRFFRFFRLFHFFLIEKYFILDERIIQVFRQRKRTHSFIEQNESYHPQLAYCHHSYNPFKQESLWWAGKIHVKAIDV